VPAPDFAVTTIDGTSVRLSEMRGRRVIVNFWATWCPPCREEIPHLAALATAISPDDLLILGITNESPDVVKPFMQQMDMGYPVATNVSLPRPYVDVTGIPTSFVIDRNGIIQHVLTGYYSEAELKGFATEGDYTGEIKVSPLAGPQDS
jgi:peroxiredoxin